VYRTIIRKTEAANISGIPWAPVFWKHTSGLYVYTCPLGDNDFEVTARIRRTKEGEDAVSWGCQFDLLTLLHEYDDFCQPVREILQLAARGNTQEFALFSRCRMTRIISHGAIAFIGDASHAMLGNFGAGVGFALEDVFTLCKVLSWAWSKGKPLADALQLLNLIRSPHYARLYGILDKFVDIKAALQEESLPIDRAIEERVKRLSQASESWMHFYDINKVVDDTILEVDKEWNVSSLKGLA
jgi:salicylate hydroxylase